MFILKRIFGKGVVFMAKEKVEIVQRFYLRDGERLYPEGGYSSIRNYQSIPGVFIVVKDLNGKKVTGLVDKKDNKILPLEFDWISNYPYKINEALYINVCQGRGEGFVCLKKEENGNWTYTITIPCKCRHSLNLHNIELTTGWVLIRSEEGKEGFANFITGAEIKPVYDFVREFRSGIAPVGKIRDKTEAGNFHKKQDYNKCSWGIINEQGEVLVPIKYTYKELAELMPEFIKKFGKKYQF